MAFLQKIETGGIKHTNKLSSILKFMLFVYFSMFVYSCVSDDNIQKQEYEPMPEHIEAYDPVNDIMARYISPVEFYNHGVLGDKIEALALEVIVDEKQLVYFLDSSMVFEDISPRFFDFDNDGLPEIVTILTHIEKGASVAVFSIHKNELKLRAQSDYVGRAYRWLNIAFIGDWDKNNIPEIAWVETPHIGGTLKVGEVVDGEIITVATFSGVSNHKYGSRNQELSFLATNNDFCYLYLPDNKYSAVYKLKYSNNIIIQVDSFAVDIDPFRPLYLQLNDSMFN